MRVKTQEDNVTRTPWLVVSAGALIAVLSACDNSAVSSPGPLRADATLRADAKGPSCVITLPAPVVRPLPAVRETARELNEAFAKPSSSVNCGVINGIGERFNTLASMLDRAFADQNLDAACGIATGLTKQLQLLEAAGQFNPIVTHPPEASPNVVENMDFIRSEFCRNAEL
jgi:hypothetical protein